ncbi:copper amine oxidase N-terminal domain-containing protein [Syntrophomonas wolfei]|uniref:Copper amine oxidase-like N-terminal domain-containing protein n=1 Tax=Syntrophomonas wolfei subsp. wolfei (strain DSM 2245B / Goettingen) TaxID=335541 RepID=Q0B0K9_SYNWW|nr:copper amine oxidase N-terminal domain-containing protein [Syntrophomonas wolfei]ABI67495.1 hypothetical protein Swol_0140 [Syntrophomonas wolfei subsp. wolfei str. Goettingen G311]
MKTKKFLSIILFALLFMFSSQPVPAAEYGVMKNTVVLPGTVNELGGIAGHYIAGQLQQGDILTFRLPLNSFWTKAPIDTDESTAMTCLQSSAEWSTTTMLDAANMRYGTDCNYILVPEAHAGNPNGLFNAANPTLAVSSLTKGEVLLEVIALPDNSQDCYLYIYSNRVYIDDSIEGDVCIDIDSPSNQALKAILPGGSIPATLQADKSPGNNQSQKEPVQDNKTLEKDSGGSSDADKEDKAQAAVRIELRIGQKKAEVNGEEKEITLAPYIKQDRTYVPIRFIAEALGIDDIRWEAESKMITLKQESKILGIDVRNNTISVNEQLAYVMDTSIETSESGYTMVPIRYIVQALGAIVDWNADNNSIILTLPGV